MKSMASYLLSMSNTWHIKEIDHNCFYCEDGHRTEQISGAHCPACVYAELVTKYGGNVDLRGLYRYHSCYQFLAVLVRQERRRNRD